MKAADIDAKKRPDFKLLRQNDVVSFFHMQMPRWLFFDERYVHLSLEAKVAYTFLLNRFQLSKMNGWMNKDFEVFIIFTREDLANEMKISYRKSIECFKELLAANLIWERRLGRGKANQIYLAAVEVSPQGSASHNSAPFVEPAPSHTVRDEIPSEETEPSRPAKTACLDDPQRASGLSAPSQELPKQHVKTCENDISRSAETAYPDVPFPHTSNKENNNTDLRKKEVSQSVTRGRGPCEVPTDDTDAYELEDILDNCELDIFPTEIAGVFANAIERLFYSPVYHIGGAVLPQPKVRSHLHRLDGCLLQDALYKLKKNLDKDIKNTTAYTMAVIFNQIWECESDLLLDPYLNRLAAG